MVIMKKSASTGTFILYLLSIHFIKVSSSLITVVNPFLPRPTQTGPTLLFYYLMPDDFTPQGRASGWERVNLIPDIDDLK